jgi:hypothetical protein
MNNKTKGYFKKGNSKMIVAICPTTGATAVENMNAVNRVIELSGGVILEPCPLMENGVYHAIAVAEEKRKEMLYL